MESFKTIKQLCEEHQFKRVTVESWIRKGWLFAVARLEHFEREGA